MHPKHQGLSLPWLFILESGKGVRLLFIARGGPEGGGGELLLVSICMEVFFNYALLISNKFQNLKQRVNNKRM